jgi:ribosomal peptide maturation radical SAM protein 1
VPRVLLISMPYGSLERPSLGLGLLQAQLQRDGTPCDTRYLAFAFADAIGVEQYVWLSRELPYTAFAGDWLFTEALYGPRPQADAAYIEAVLRREWRLDDAAIARLLALRGSCQPFLEHCLGAVPWERYDVVGFTSTFEQNIASLALARQLKARRPELFVVFGGANWEGAMGRELHRRFPCVDAVCSGEADHSFPALLATLDHGRSPAGVRGIVYRRDGRSVATGPAPLVRDLDALPIPDFEPWMRDRKASSAGAMAPTMLLETGRGCWWGAKSHCTFCGLNGGSLAFRAKSPERALTEIRDLRERYGVEFFSAVDNILDMGYFRTLLPRLAAEPPGMTFFYEVKANLSAEQVALLAAAGVTTIQPGVESLSDHVLKLMRKGSTALQNVQLLKWCREHGVRPEWNLLYGFPGETAQDHADTLAMMDAIWFLDAPSGYGPVRLDRFAPYHEDPAAYGMTNVRPMAPYRYLYPFGRESLEQIAYYFDYDHHDPGHRLPEPGPLVERVRRWMADERRGTLRLLHDGQGSLVVDDRPPAGRRGLRLHGWQVAAYDACDRVRTRDGLARMPELARVGADQLTGFLDACVAQRIMVRNRDQYLSLAVATPARAWQASDDRIAMEAAA